MRGEMFRIMVNHGEFKHDHKVKGNKWSRKCFPLLTKKIWILYFFQRLKYCNELFPISLALIRGHVGNKSIKHCYSFTPFLDQSKIWLQNDDRCINWLPINDIRFLEREGGSMVLWRKYLSVTARSGVKEWPKFDNSYV